MSRIRNARVAAGMILLGAAVAIVATRVGFLQGNTPSGSARNDAAPEFRDIASWLNSPPLTIARLRGTVVLIDFWTYSCVNCVRTFPGLRELYARYHPFGLEIVGVHSPEFDFEKLEANVRAAISENHIAWPVAMDSEMGTWRAYRNHYWPANYLIDAKGTIRYDHFGEGGEELIQSQIRTLLAEKGASLPAPIDFSEPASNSGLTREIYAGYDRGGAEGSLGNPEGYRPEQIVDYKPVPNGTVAAAGTDGTIFLEGPWRASPEYLEAAADGARVLLPFRAQDVFIVASSADGPVDVKLLLDGVAVPANALGADAGGGVAHVSRPDLYRLLHLGAAGEHRLTLVAGKGFRLYTFTFG